MLLVLFSFEGIASIAPLFFGLLTFFGKTVSVAGYVTNSFATKYLNDTDKRIVTLCSLTGKPPTDC